MKLIRTLFFARTSIMRVVPLMRDGRVSLGLKAAVIALALFIVSPLNILGDIPLLGFFDDAALILMLSTWFVSHATRHIEHRVSPLTGTALETI